MTFILALANDKYVIQLSDRRLTADRNIKDEESNKAGFLICNDARALFAFTGIAESEHRTFKTRRWILETLREAGPPDHNMREMIERFKDLATEYFARSPTIGRMPKEYRRLSLMWTGFATNGRIVNAIITNFQDVVSGEDAPEAWNEFRLYPFISRECPEIKPTFVQRIGAWRAMTVEDERTLRQMLHDGKPRVAVKNKAVEIFNTIAHRPAAAGTVGDQISVACLEIESLFPIASFYPGAPRNSIPLIDMVDCREGSPCLQISDTTLHVTGSSIVAPKVGRNQPCPCGSGKKYKFCHGQR